MTNDHSTLKTNKAGLEAAAARSLRALRPFISASQRAAIAAGCRGEEARYFLDMVNVYAERISNMPKTYETEKVKAEDKIAHLHYFTGGCDWYIIERDSNPDQNQAFGSANIGYGAELGYISIAELIANRVELDLHFTPRPLGAVIGRPS